MKFFLQDFETQIWRIRYKISEYNEKSNTRKGVEYWKIRSYHTRDFLIYLMKRRKIASILFAEKTMNLAKGNAPI